MNRLRLFMVALVLLTASKAAATDAPDLVSKIQRHLAFLGYYPGSVNSNVDDDTKAAISAFQRASGFRITGLPSESLYIYLRMRVEEEKFRRSPAGEQRWREAQSLIALSNAEFAQFLDRADQASIQYISELVPGRLIDAPARLWLSKVNPPGAFELGVSSMLAQLLYPPSPLGVLHFQSDIGASPDGDLSGRQYFELFRRWSRQRETPIYLSGGLSVYISKHTDRVLVSGSWVGIDERLADELSTSEIECDKAKRICIEGRTIIKVPPLEVPAGKLVAALDDPYFVRTSLTFFDISTWTSDKVIARRAGTCSVSLLTIDAATKQVIEETNRVEDDGCVPMFDGPVRSQVRMASSDEVSVQFWKLRKDITKGYINSRAFSTISSEDSARKSRP